MILLDRSNSIKEADWYQNIVPFATSLINDLDMSNPNVRVGVVVFPGASGGKKDETSGGARLQQPLTSDKALVLSHFPITSQFSQCSDQGATDGLSFPCSNWGYTPTWHALEEAKKQFDTNPSTSQRSVIVVTDGAPSAIPAQGCDDPPNNGKHTRPVYLTLRMGQVLKQNYGATIFGVGIDNGNGKWDDYDAPNCNPFCAEGGNGLFEGQNNMNGIVRMCGGNIADPYEPKSCLTATQCVDLPALASSTIENSGWFVTIPALLNGQVGKVKDGVCPAGAAL